MKCLRDCQLETVTSCCLGLRKETTNNMAAIIEYVSKDEALTEIFNRFDKDFTGELTAEQLQELHASIRDGGISLPQVVASMEEVCACETCDRRELFDALNEMDRRYYLVRDLQWEFSMLDREKKGTISEKAAKFLFQAVHDEFFSPRRWLKFLRSRAAPGSGISFAEIEVQLCNIPTLDWLEEEKQDEDKEKEEVLRRNKKSNHSVNEKQEKVEQEARKAAEKKAKLERDMAKRKEDAARKKAEAEAMKRKAEQDELERKAREKEEEENRRKREEEMQKRSEEEAKLREEEERLKEEEAMRLAEEERKKREQEEAAQKWKKEELLKQQELEREKEERVCTCLFTGLKPDIDKAETTLKNVQAGEDLKSAITRRHLGDIEKSMAHINKNGWQKDWTIELKEGEKLAQRLRRLEKLKAEIMELKQSVISEIRSYQNPSPFVHKVMIATYLLLNYREKELLIWKNVQALLGKTGKEGLKRQVTSLDPLHVDMTRANFAFEKYLTETDLEAIRDISAGAATFYVWATNMIEEVHAVAEQKEKLLEEERKRKEQEAEDARKAAERKKARQAAKKASGTPGGSSSQGTRGRSKSPPRSGAARRTNSKSPAARS
ncbi:PREDICTED: trichohyalin-like [Acropora digitifera]|uniref:trichohyalin-like n=1 Tax=Acropora digitifera TaxID=70779 RepID=UPI00077A77F8|nr:PREDICTED: trichohyalin-like [Acropora digitifera]